MMDNPMTPDTDNDYSVTRNVLTFDGAVITMAGIALSNLLLTILTLGIYEFWAKTRMRRYIWGRMALSSERFEYIGTGKELFFGFLKVFFLILLPLGLSVGVVIGLLSALFDAEVMAIIIPIMNVLFYVIMLYLIFVASYISFRYLSSRTVWRGLRFNLRGSAWVYGREAWVGIVLSFITLGILYPRFEVRTYGVLIKNLHFGSANFKFDGQWQHLMKMHLVTMVLSPFTLGLSRLWYVSKSIDYRYQRTTIHGLALQSTYTPWELFKLYVGNGILATFAFLPFILVIMSVLPDAGQQQVTLPWTLWLIIPALFWMGLLTIAIQHRTLSYFAANVALVGNIETSGVMQVAEQKAGVGDELAEALEVDGLGVGVGL